MAHLVYLGKIDCEMLRKYFTVGQPKETIMGAASENFSGPILVIIALISSAINSAVCFSFEKSFNK